MEKMLSTSTLNDDIIIIKHLRVINGAKTKLNANFENSVLRSLTFTFIACSFHIQLAR